MANDVSPGLAAQRFYEQEASHTLRAKTGTLHAYPDTVFQIEDDADATKILKFSVGGIATATTRTITVPDADISLSGVGGLRTVVSNSTAVYATPVVLTQADAGKIQLCNVATGIDFTLPAVTSSNIGMTFEFFITVEVTSNTYRWTAQSGDLLFGHVWLTDKDAATGDANALIGQFRPNGSSHLVLTITGSDDTQGSLVGGSLKFTAITATGWFVQGDLIGDGSLATVFS